MDEQLARRKTLRDEPMRRQIRKRPRLRNGAQGRAGDTRCERHAPVGQDIEEIEEAAQAEAEVVEAVGLAAGEAG